MIQSGYVRLIAASVAAISLHALLFSMIPGQQKAVQFHPPGSLQIELLAQQEQVQSDQEKTVVETPIRSRHETSNKNELKKQLKADLTPREVITQAAPITVVDHKTVTFIPAEKESVQEKRGEESSLVEAVEIREPNKNVIAKKSSDKITAPVSASAQTTIIPQHIQSDIIASVHYPRQARRRGWQGEAQFLLNINAQTIQAVTMLASTGYPILDRAAQRGLSAVHHIPLSNGLYQMPVSFRLQ